ncbi:SHOCT domain-containing protein [Paenisporosarcina sp. TG-14]|uniref:SHOCT domain-containing protein n=1 Tax=Paenisporosarcina sp. TG-14 TaxID=1231057 RepID=UPI0002DAC619|nr:SHOCT domain-containing protein [Paenisporosarcina sp. TG-14]
MGYGMGYGMGGGVLMWIVLLLIIGFVVYYFAKNKNANGSNSSQQVLGPDAMEIAKIRLAKGEISSEEFEDIKKNIL